ncbi:hypothetical protein [Rhodovulum sulfidophilum]|uniref:hypothetical protein n=1 Tax=Rhodovulum sulfidophilum TaxID=35806 RepID=UPI0019131AF9|nr:hypothetical protein [Rhodovulum sulfidophilum]
MRLAEQQFSVMAHRLKIAKASAKELADAFYDLRQADSFDDKADALARIRRIILQSSAAGAVVVFVMPVAFRFASQAGQWSLPFTSAQPCPVIFRFICPASGTQTRPGRCR